jgi:tetratricopeptide (TPR) repeat protein
MATSSAFCLKCRTPISIAASTANSGSACPVCRTELASAENAALGKPGGAEPTRTLQWSSQETADFPPPVTPPNETVTHVPSHAASAETNSTRIGGSDSSAASRSPDADFVDPNSENAAFLANYEIRDEIARGGMGRVLAARELALDREVAIKTLLPGANPIRFLTESRITACLPHPNIPPVYALGQLEDGSPYLAMKYIRGQTLAAELESRPSPKAEQSRFLLFLEQIALAVGFAHARGIIHRDLKPSNIMLGEFGEVQVMDWGLARRMRSTMPIGGEELPEPDGPLLPTDLTQAGKIMGTPAYMAPEQARGEEADPRADVFALGGILTAILTGQAVFAGHSLAKTIELAAAGDTSDAMARLRQSGVDPELIRIAEQCLAADRDRRPANGTAVAQLLVEYREGIEQRGRKAEAERVAAAAKLVEQKKRKRVQLALLVSVFALVLAGIAFAWWESSQRSQRERDEALVKQEREFKQAQANQSIEASMKLSEELRRQFKFKPAAAALAQAAELASSVPEKFDTVRAAQRDLEFAVELDDIRYRKWIWVTQEGGRGEFQVDIAPPEYRRLFAARQWDLFNRPAADLAQQVANSPIRRELIAALDDWALYEPQRADRDQLLAVARLADPGPWSDRLRNSGIREVPASVQDLVASANPQQLSPQIFSVLLELMKRHMIAPTGLLQESRLRYPDSFEVMFLLATLSGQQFANWQSSYESACALRPDNAVSWANLGEEAFRKRDYRAAIGFWKQSLELNPRLAVVRNNLGFAYREIRDVAAAEAAFKAAIEIDAKFPHPHSGLGVLCHEKGEFPEAVQHFQKAIELRPRLLAAHTNLGLAYSALGQHEKAIASHRAALNINANDSAVWNNLGGAFFKNQDPRTAITHYQKAISLQPRYGKAHCNLAVAHDALKEYPAAIEAYRKAILYEPGAPSAYNNLAILLFDLKRYPEAVSVARDLIQLDPENAVGHAVAGTSYFEMGQKGLAQAFLREAIRLNPKTFGPRLEKYLDTKANPGAEAEAQARRISAFLSQAGFYMSQQKHQEAAAIYRKVLEIQAKNTGALFGLGSALLSMKEYAEAEKTIRTHIALDPKFAVSHANLAYALRLQQKYPETIAAAREALKLNPTLAGAHYSLGVALRETGDAAGAQAAFDEAARLNPKQYGTAKPREVLPAPRPVQ